jgi:AraC-like DNA-binding protein
MQETIVIKGMVCDRCILTIQNEFSRIGIPIVDVQLGLLTFNSKQSPINWELVSQKLSYLGFQLLEDRKKITVREVKNLVREICSGDYDFPYSFRLSKLVSDRLHLDYDYISGVFSSSENITIEKYFLEYRIEKAKEFLVYSSKSISEISFMLGFNSIAHMSRQFKMLTGLTPSYFRSVAVRKLSTQSAADKYIT